MRCKDSFVDALISTLLVQIVPQTTGFSTFLPAVHYVCVNMVAASPVPHQPWLSVAT